MFFVIIARDRDGSAAVRAAAKAAHMAHLDRGADGAVVRQSGPLLDSAGAESGSLIIVEARDGAAVAAFLAEDPYVAADLFAGVEIREWAWRRGNPYLGSTVAQSRPNHEGTTT